MNYCWKQLKIFKPKRAEKSCDSMASDLYFILGKSQISDEDHLPFLRDIITSKKEDAKALFAPLETFLKLAQKHGYLIEHEKGQNKNPLITEANLLSSSLYWLSELFQSFSEDERSEVYKNRYLRVFGQEDSFYEFISFLRGAKLLKYPIIAFNLYLRDAYLKGAYLSGANLRDTDLRDTNLIGTDLRGAKLFGADLSNAKNLTREQIAEAITDETTILPDYLKEGEK